MRPRHDDNAERRVAETPILPVQLLRILKATLSPLSSVELDYGSTALTVERLWPEKHRNVQQEKEHLGNDGRRKIDLSELTDMEGQLLGAHTPWRQKREINSRSRRGKVCSHLYR